MRNKSPWIGNEILTRSTPRGQDSVVLDRGAQLWYLDTMVSMSGRVEVEGHYAW